MKEKIWKNIFLFAKPTILTPRCDAHREVEFFELCERISQWNRNRIQKYLAFLSEAQVVSNQEKNGGKKSCDTLPLITAN